MLDGIARLGDLAVPGSCAGCGAPGGRWCGDCLESLAVELAPGVVTGRLGGVPLWAAGDYTGSLRALVRAYKDGERRDVRAVLAAVTAPVLQVARAAAAADLGLAVDRIELLVVPAPSRGAARRARGDDPVADLARAAAARAGTPTVRVLPALRMAGAVRDQSRLGRGQRRENLAGRVHVRGRVPPPRLPEAVVVLDDVVTTGSTLRACRDALAPLHPRWVGAVCCARVP
ncbi:ComF family protein [Kytococcus sp. Marseille-QA3725]